MQLKSERARAIRAVAVGIVGAAALVALPTEAATTYTYSRLTASTDQWSTGDGWNGGTAPVSGSDTLLNFGGPPVALGTFAAGSGPTIVSNNNLAGAAVNLQGQFELNQLSAFYASPSGASNTSASVTISGGPLLFLNDGATTPAISLRSNSFSTGTVGAKPIVTLANNLVLGSPSLRIAGESNFAGGPVDGIVKVTGTLTYTTARAHSIELGGDHSATASAGLNSRNVIDALIADHSAGNATSLIKSGTSFWELTSANTYTGGTTINGGVLRASVANGMGTGPIGVATGGQAWLEVAGTYGNSFSIAGNGVGNLGALRLGKDVILSPTSTITLTDNARIGTSSLRTEFVTVNSRITGTGNLTFGVGLANTPTITIGNPANDYVGNTTLLGESSTTSSTSSTSAQNVRLGASNVIPAGNLTLQMGTRANLSLELRGFDETVNGLNSAGQGLITRVITNGNTSGSSASTLTVGDNDAGGTYRGQITGTSTNTVALTKVGAGQQILAGTSTYFGATTVSGGRLTLDYNIYSSSQTGSPTNYFTQNSTLVLNGGTFAIDGRGSAAEVTKTGTNAGRFFTITGGDTSDLVAGQLITAVTSISGPIYIAGIDRVANTAYLSEVPSPGLTSLTTVAMTAGVTSQTIKGLTIDAPAGVESTLDFGTSGGVVLTFGNFAQTNDGSRLTITNWDGSLAGGGNDQLIFTGTPSAFTSLFDQTEVSFAGYGQGYDIIPGTGNFEVVAVPVPEPVGLTALAAGGLLLLGRRRHRLSGW